MKQENYNLNINTLDDKVIYQEICKKITETDAISFKLLGLVPTASWVAVTISWFESHQFSFWGLLLLGLFGAWVTYFIYRWERRNIQVCNTFREYARIMEAKKMAEESAESLNGALNGPYSLLKTKNKPNISGRPTSSKGWGKTEAETAIYFITILLWLILPWLTLL